jgi:hypothetical protein
MEHGLSESRDPGKREQRQVRVRGRDEGGPARGDCESGDEHPFSADTVDGPADEDLQEQRSERAHRHHETELRVRQSEPLHEEREQRRVDEDVEVREEVPEAHAGNDPRATANESGDSRHRRPPSLRVTRGGAGRADRMDAVSGSSAVMCLTGSEA